MGTIARAAELVEGYYRTLFRPDYLGRPDLDWGNDALPALAEIVGVEWARAVELSGMVVAVVVGVVY